jgi:predicted RND superfamily exporter protein
MQKLTAIICVVSWSGFWAFGFLALSSSGFTEMQLLTAAMLAFVGLVTGVAAYLRLARFAQENGYERASGQLDVVARNQAQAEHYKTQGEF